MTNLFDENFWDERYSGSKAVWSGQANPQLVAEMSVPGAGQSAAPTPRLNSRSPNPHSPNKPNKPSNERPVDEQHRGPKIARTALDVGCGEGADAIWLASQGWDVTAVDISRVALRRAKEHAAAMYLEDSISWEYQDLLTWTPPVSSFDLVSSQFMHLAKDDREPLYARLATAVTLGGTLLIVGHSASDIQAGARRPDAPDLYFTADEIADSLDPQQWKVLVSELRPRSAQNSEGEPITIHDVVLRATRLA